MKDLLLYANMRWGEGEGIWIPASHWPLNLVSPPPFLVVPTSWVFILLQNIVENFPPILPPYPLVIPLPTPTPSLPEKYPPPSLPRFRPLSSQAFWNIPVVVITPLIISVSAHYNFILTTGFQFPGFN